MSLTPQLTEIDYPESDGMPMAESDLHREWMIHVYDMLRCRYREQRVYISSDLLVYYVEGDPRRFVVPDVFVVLDCEPGLRRNFRIWEEQRSPDVVFEVTSHSTRWEDERFKPRTYARMGVKELFLYDPTSDYLKPPLQGFRLDDDEVVRMVPESSGRLHCETLGVLLHLDDRRLVLADAETGERLPTEAEAERWRREQAEARAESEAVAREHEQQRREEAESRAKAAEQELQRLRDELRRRDGQED